MEEFMVPCYLLNFKSTQSAVLGMHNIIERPVVVKGNIEVRPVMYYLDHRIVDGKKTYLF